MRWTIKLVVTATTAKYTSIAVAALNTSGFFDDDIEIVAAKGTPLGVDDAQASKKKLKKKSLSGCTVDGIQSQLFAEVFTGQSASFISNTDVLMVLTPNIILWSGFKDFMEATIEPKFISVYFPYTPSRFFLVNDRPLPANQYGWYRFDCDEPLGGSSCICMNSHTAALMGSMIGQDIASDPGAWCTVRWDYLLSQVLTRCRADCYGAGVPFAYSLGVAEDLERVVALDRRLKPGFEKMNWYRN